MIDWLVQALAKSSELSAEEILDVLWLSAAFPADNAGTNWEPGGSDSESEPDTQAKEGDAADSSADAPVPLRIGGEPADYGELVAATEVGFRSPRSIPDALTLPAALRRLRRIRAPGPEIAVDIDATVEATAEAGGRLITEVTRPLQRVLDLALVVDGSSSMDIWTETLDEFERLLAQTGAFRTVSRWTLRTLNGTMRLEAPDRSPHPPRRLTDPSGRRLVLVATDGRDKSWYSAGPWDMIAAWCAAMPTALVQVLPPQYWAQTAVGEPFITARALRQAAPNSQYARRLDWWAADPGGPPLPVVTLTAEALGTWAEAAVGGTAWASGITATPPDGEDDDVGADDPMNPENPDDLVNDFLSKASPGAERLARVLAGATTLSMSLIAVLQERLAPTTGVVERAEVLASGLLEETGPAPGAGQFFRYRPGAREILRQGATRFDEWAAYAAVSRYLEDRQRLGGSLRVLIADPAGTAKLDTGDEPIGALYETLVNRLGLRAGFADSTEPEQPAVEPVSQPGGPPAPGPGKADSSMGTAAESARDALDREIRALGDLAEFTVVEFTSGSLDVWRISRDWNGTPQAGIVSRPPSSSLDDPAEFYAERLVPLLPHARMFIARGSPREPISAVFELLAGGGARAYYSATPTRDLMRESIENSPLTRPYHLVVGRRQAGGPPTTGTQLDTQPLFLAGAVRGDRRLVTVRCGSGDGHRTVFAVVTRSGHDFGRTPVTVQSAVLEPGDYPLAAVLTKPGQVRFEGLPVKLRTDPRPWSEIVATVPDQLAAPQPVHLVVAIEVSGGRDLLNGRIQRVEQLIASAKNPVRRLAVSVIAYCPHSVERAVREEAATVLAWATTSERALRALRSLAPRETPAREYTRAAQLECALDEVVARLDQRDGRVALVTVGGRPPHPPQVDLRSEIIPCRNRVDWRRKVDQLRGIPGITFGALCDPEARGDIWRKLGQDAFATVDIMDVDQFARRLGLHERVQAEPFPLVRHGGLAAQRQESADRATAQADIALWGTPGSGKTTFLSALSIALAGSQHGYTMAANNDASESLLIRATAALAEDREFPVATQGIDLLQWSLFGRHQRTAQSGRDFRIEDRPNRLTLKLVDPAGELTLQGRLADVERRQLIDPLAHADGIIFMYDPIRELRTGDAFASINGLVQQLSRQIYSSDPGSGGRLPHYVAVCVTKFDEPPVLDTAEKLDLVRYVRNDPYGFPRVADDDARRLFARLSSAANAGRDGLVLNLLEQHFHRERVKFFITSAIGFYVNQETSRFDRDDYQNVVEAVPGPGNLTRARIRGPIHPINVAEPILWLAENIPAPFAWPDSGPGRPPRSLRKTLHVLAD